MNKEQLIAKVQERCGLNVTKTTVESIVNAAVQVMGETLALGDKVTLVGFGTLKPVARAAREGRNPKTGETVFIDAKTTVKFKVGKELLEAVNGH